MLAQLPPALQKLQLPLRLRLWDGHEFNFGPSPSVTIVVKDPTLVAQFTHPSLDLLGSAFVEGRLELEGSISEAIRVCDELSQALLDDDEDTTPPRVHHDKATDAESISYHYDLSNDFYQLWLDRDMAYSCGYFETGEESLDEAQQAKFRLLCRKLRLKPGEYLLDVGCGWGGLARFAAREYGVKVFGITLSKEQLTLARERVNAEGLQDKVDLQLLDYRDLPQDGRFDKIPRATPDLTTSVCLEVMSWFMTNPPSRTALDRISQYSRRLACPTCSNIPTLTILSNRPS